MNLSPWACRLYPPPSNRKHHLTTIAQACVNQDKSLRKQRPRLSSDRSSVGVGERRRVMVWKRNATQLKFMYLNTWSPVGGAIWEASRIFRRQSLLAEVGHWRWNLGVCILVHFLFSLFPVCAWKCYQSASLPEAMISLIVVTPPYQDGLCSFVITGQNKPFLPEVVFVKVFITVTEKKLIQKERRGKRGKRKKEWRGEELEGRGQEREDRREGFYEVICCPTSLHIYHLHTSLKAVNGTKEIQNVLCPQESHSLVSNEKIH